MSGLDCESCGGKLHLIHSEKLMKLKNGEKITFTNVPLLICGGCQKKYIPYLTKEILDEFQNMLENTEQENQPQSIDIVEKEEFSAEETETRYNFLKLKNMIFKDKFIAEKVKFLYDKDDYYFIPGLVRPWKIGFLTPVFLI